MNQYIYFSSKGSNESVNQNSDFSVNFSNPIVIPPYAEIRCVNCRINPDNNTYNVVEGENDKLAFSVGKFWVDQDDDEQNGFPLFTVKLKEGIYDLSQGTDKDFHLNAQIEHQINSQITNMPNLRNGVTVSINANKKITVKVSPMGGNGYYSVPATTIPEDLLDKMRRQNSRTTSIPMLEFAENPQEEELYEGFDVLSSPFNIRAADPATNMIPPNQVGKYDVTCDSLVGTFDVGDVIEIVADTNITATVNAVSANLPTEITLNETSDLWKTNENPCNVNVKNGANTCRITQFTSSIVIKGVNLYAVEASQSTGQELTYNDCKYFMSPPVTWNSLGDWSETTGKEMKLASIFSIDLSALDMNAIQDDGSFRFCYSCFNDSLTGMDCGSLSAGKGAGPWSGTVDPVQAYSPEFEVPSAGADDFLTKLDPDEVVELESYIYRIQFQRYADDANGDLKVYLKDTVGPEWDFMGYKNYVTDAEPETLEVAVANTILTFETYVSSAVDTNANKVQLVIKSSVGGATATTIMNLRGMIVNNLGFHKLTDKRALDSKTLKPANIRFAYGHNAPLSRYLGTTGDNFTSFDKLYFSCAYNPIDENNGYVDGAFRDADFITSKAEDLPTKLPVLLFGDDTIDENDKSYIVTNNPLDGVVVPWGVDADARLLASGANGGIPLGLDENGFQFVNADSYTTGLQFEGTVNANSRDYPQHYLDLPDLPINNVTGTATFGRQNRFIAPLDLNSGGSQNNIHTSQNETLVYNSLGNAYEERITSLRIRICDIDGTPSANLQNYTFGCLEIKENDFMKQAKMQRVLKQQENEMLQYQSAVQPNQFNRVQ
jgi:hypothetical protein